MTTSGGGQTYNSNVVLDASTTVIDTGNGAINFSNAVIQANTGAEGLTISTGSSGSVTVNTVGVPTSLANLTVTGPTTISSDITTSGTQTYNGTVTLSGSPTHTLDSSSGNGAITFASSINGNGLALTLNSGSGAQTLDGFTTSAPGNLTLTTIGVVTLNAGNYTIPGPYTFPAVTTNGTLTLGQATTFGNIALGSATTIDSSAVNGSLTFAKIDGAQGLVVKAGTGVASFDGAVGSGMPLTSLAVTSDPVLNADVTTNGSGQTYNGPISLGAPVTLSDTGGGAIALNGQVTGSANSFALSTTGAETLSGVTTTGNLTLGTPASLMLNAGPYTITGGTNPYVFPGVATTLSGTVTLGMATTFDGAVALGSSTTVDSSGANAAVDFASTVDGLTPAGQSLTLTTGTGTATFGSNVGGTDPLLNLTVNAGSISLGGSIAATGTMTLTSTGSGALTLPFNLSGNQVFLSSGGAITQTAGGITAGTLTGGADGAVGLAAAGNSNNIATLGSFAVTGASFALSDPNAGTLTVAGSVSASSIAISGPTAGNLIVTSGVSAPSGLVQFTGGTGVQLNTGATVNGGTVDLVALNGPLTEFRRGDQRRHTDRKRRVGEPECRQFHRQYRQLHRHLRRVRDDGRRPCRDAHCVGTADLDHQRCHAQRFASAQRYRQHRCQRDSVAQCR